MRVKAMYSVALMALALLVTSGPVQASKTDDRIETAAKESYVFKTYLKDDAIKINSKDGAVTLTGTVAEESHKSLAGETVASLPEVKRVDNQLEVKGAPAEKSDAWLTTKVKTTLLFHRHVSAMTKVDTKDGIVTLQGEAPNLAQKDLTTEYAKDIEGVKDVKNEMTVAKSADATRTEYAKDVKEAKDAKDAKKEMTVAKSADATRTVGDKIDDASITALVKTSLLYHRSTSGLKTSVTTKDGVVTLTGKAKNAAEVALATKFANDVNGVESVNNKMTVE